MKFVYELTDEIQIILHGEEILRKKTDFQEMIVLKTEEFGKYLFLDNVTQICERDEYIYHESIIHPAMLAHPNPKKILVIGGGDGGCVRELLKHPVEKVTLIELDPEVVKVSKEHFPEVSSGLNDERVEILHQDGRKYLEETSEKFDVIILDLTDPTGPSAKLFTKEFYEIVKSKLEEKGIVSMDADTIEFQGVFGHLVKTFYSAFKHVYPFTTYVPSYFMSQGFAICSQESLDYMKDEKEVQERLEKAKLSLKLYNARSISNLFHTSEQIKQLMKEDWQVSIDEKPIEIKPFKLYS